MSGEARRPRRGWGAGLAAGGELVHRAADGPRHRLSQTAPRPAGFPKVAQSALSASLRLCLSALKYYWAGCRSVRRYELKSNRARIAPIAPTSEQGSKPPKNKGEEGSKRKMSPQATLKTTMKVSPQVSPQMSPLNISDDVAKVEMARQDLAAVKDSNNVESMTPTAPHGSLATDH